MTKASQKVSRNDSRVRGNSSSRNKLLWITGLGAAIIATTALAFIVFAPPSRSNARRRDCVQQSFTRPQ